MLTCAMKVFQHIDSSNIVRDLIWWFFSIDHEEDSRFGWQSFVTFLLFRVVNYFAKKNRFTKSMKLITLNIKLIKLRGWNLIQSCFPNALCYSDLTTVFLGQTNAKFSLLFDFSHTDNVKYDSGGQMLIVIIWYLTVQTNAIPSNNQFSIECFILNYLWLLWMMNCELWIVFMEILIFMYEIQIDINWFVHVLIQTLN